ncbi:MAG TPA: dihydroneopterin aldolase [Acidobacteriota bacterium]|nr:dihydroneopterin aldolase [Acidobacteriota bacterium]
MAWIELKGIRCMSQIGVSARERGARQELRIDLALQVDVRRAVEGDDLNETVNYRRLVRTVQNTASSNSFRLIETLASRLLDRLFETEDRIQNARIRVRKRPDSLRREVEYAAVTLSRRRTGARRDDPT